MSATIPLCAAYLGTIYLIRDIKLSLMGERGAQGPFRPQGLPSSMSKTSPCIFKRTFVSGKPLRFFCQMEAKLDNTLKSRQRKPRCRDGEPGRRWPELPVQFGFSVPTFPRQFLPPPRCNTPTSPSAVPEPSALVLALAFRHLTVGAGRILANLEISSPARTTWERVS